MWAIVCIWSCLWTVSFKTMTMANPWDFGKTDNVTQTITHILKTYDVRLRPNFGGDPLYIGIETTLDSFLKVSEVNMDYTITIYLNQYWKDERLAFSSDETMLTLSGDFAERIWVPDTFFANDKQSFLHDVTEKNKMVRLHGDGSVMYGMRFTTTLSCMMDLHYYPLDSQNCTVEIESYGYTVRDLVMYWKGESVMGVDKVKPPQFQILGFETNDRTEELATGVYQRLSLSFSIKRETSYFIFQTYLPSILIVMLSWVAFWINHEAVAARVALGITTVLTMTTLSSAVRASLPRISYVKAIDIYLVMCFVFVFAALLEYATVNNTYWEKKEVKVKVPKPASKSKSKSKEKLKLPKIEVSDSDSSRGAGSSSGAGTGTGTGPGTRLEKESENNTPRKKSTLEAVGLRLRDNPFKSSSSSSSSKRGGENKDPDPLYDIEVLDTSFLPVLAVGRLPRSTSFSGTSGLGAQHPSHQQQGIYISGPNPNLPLSVIGKQPRPKVPWRQRNRKIVQSIKKHKKAFDACLPDIRKDVNIIDKCSRLAFPLSFIAFNIGYWGFYHMNS